MSFLAPQAYTKETLAKAFDWLQHQPPEVAQAATTPDNLVAIYMKAQRAGHLGAGLGNGLSGQLNLDVEAPVSSKKFLDDLKSLKKEMAPFEEATPTSKPEVRPEVQHSVHRIESSSPMTPPSFSAPQMYVRETASFTRETAQSTSLQLDARSLEAVTEIQNRFNLSSPQEALRMLVTVGHKHIAHWP